MKTVVWRWRWVIVAACVLQAATLAYLGLALAWAPHGRPAARQPPLSVPRTQPPVPQTPPPVPQTTTPGTSIYYHPLSVTVDVPQAGVLYTVRFPPNLATRSVTVARDEPAQVYVTVTNPGPALPDAWFSVSVPPPSAAGVTQLQTVPQGGVTDTVVQVSELRSGTSHFMFTVPASDLPAGFSPVILMGEGQGRGQLIYAIGRLKPAGH